MDTTTELLERQYDAFWRAIGGAAWAQWQERTAGTQGPELPDDSTV
ncbi:hypothetical protein GCM10027053_52210 [Intrasporangium mesophilum]